MYTIYSRYQSSAESDLHDPKFRITVRNMRHARRSGPEGKNLLEKSGLYVHRCRASIRLFKPCSSARLAASTNEHVRFAKVCAYLASSNHVQGGGDRRRRHGRRGRGEGSVLGPAAGTSAGHERADPVVAVPRGHRRVRGHAHLPLRQPRHRHRLQGPVRRPAVHRRGVPRRRLGLWRHHLRPRLLHRRRLRRSHQPGGDVRAVRGEEAVAGAHGAVHRGAVPRRHLRRGHGEGDRGGQLRGPRRRRKLGGRRRLGRGGARRGDRRHVRAGVHRALRHRPQAHRARLLHPRAGAAAHRLRRVHRAPGHHTHHRHRHQPGQEPRRRRHVQPAQGMERPLDILGGAAPRRDGGCVVPPVRAARRGRQGAGLIQEHRRRHRTNLIVYACDRSKLVGAYAGSNLVG